MGPEHVSREVKLMVTKDIVSHYVKERENLSADDVCDAIRKIYNTINEIAPEPEPRKIGLA